jgi:hypothetical protein
VGSGRRRTGVSGAFRVCKKDAARLMDHADKQPVSNEMHQNFDCFNCGHAMIISYNYISLINNTYGMMKIFNNGNIKNNIHLLLTGLTSSV